MLSDTDNKKFVEVTDEETNFNDPSFSDDYRSREIQDIISGRSGFWGTWALPMFLSILLLIVAGTWFILYPDAILANATITATNAPKEVIARQEGKLVGLFVQAGDTVLQGEPIGWIESTADHAGVIRLSSLLDSAVTLLGNNETDKASAPFLTGTLKSWGNCSRPGSSLSPPGSNSMITW